MQRGTAQVGVHAVLLGRACFGLLWHLATDHNLRLRLEWNQLGRLTLWGGCGPSCNRDCGNKIRHEDECW
jgi:hypothetical protein